VTNEVEEPAPSEAEGIPFALAVPKCVEAFLRWCQALRVPHFSRFLAESPAPFLPRPHAKPWGKPKGGDFAGALTSTPVAVEETALTSTSQEPFPFRDKAQRPENTEYKELTASPGELCYKRSSP
jgi:hypothetical protein